MIKRLFTIILASVIISANIWATNEERDIIFIKGDINNDTIFELPYGNISFKLIEYGDYNRVLVSLENTTMSQAILLFNNAQEEKSLKKHKPKIQFEKTYPGDKGKRVVSGCNELNQSFVSIIPQDTTLFGFDASTTSITEFKLPIYLAKYDPKKLVKKGAYNITYKILSEEIIVFNIEIKKVWNEKDPDYVSTKTAVEDYINVVDTVSFCNNRKHIPSLEQQLKPYQERKDSLISIINSTIKDHGWWATDKPRIKYTELLTRLDSINFDEHIRDCRKHDTTTPPPHCSYCSLSAQQIYHQLDDTYQQLRAGIITKDAAIGKAQKLRKCYNNHKRSRKSSNYTEKISRFYSRIAAY